MSDRMIRSIENGITLPKFDYIMKISNMLDMSFGDINILAQQRKLHETLISTIYPNHRQVHN